MSWEIKPYLTEIRNYHYNWIFQMFLLMLMDMSS